MKIVLIGQKGIPASWGGVERHVDQLARRLASRELSVTVYARRYYVTPAAVAALEKATPNLKVVVLPTLRSKHLDTIFHTLVSTLHAMLVVRPDLYHYHSVGPALVSWLPRVFRPASRVVATSHSPDRLHQKWGWFARLMLTLGERAALTFPHTTVTVSRDLQRYCRETYRKATHYIPNGVEEPQLRKASLITAEYGLEGDDYFLVVSRLVRHKGIHYLIQAYRDLDTDKKLVIVGDSAYTDDYVAELKALAGHDQRIIFTGYQTGKILEELFSNCALYIQPSESEGLSVAVLEAGSYGRPVLGSDIPSNSEVLLGRGFLFENRNVADLAEQLYRLERRTDLCEKSGRELRSHILANYDWEQITDATQEVYAGAEPSRDEVFQIEPAESQA